MKIVVAGATGTVGAQVVALAGQRGHDVVALSRKTGQDLTTGRGLAEALAGAEVVIDVSNQMSMSTRKSVDFFTRVTGNLQGAARAAGVGHHVALSIVGIDGLDTGYNAGKLAQERLVAQGAVPWSIQRATQFHEFAGQVLQQAAIGPMAVIPKMLLRPVAAWEVAQRLLEVAESAPSGRTTDLVGPRDETLIDMVRSSLAQDGLNRRLISVSPPGKYWRAARSGVLRGSANSLSGQMTYDQWLAVRPR